MTNLALASSMAGEPIGVELAQTLYNNLNHQHFGGKLPPCRLEFSGRLVRTAAKIWPQERLIRLSVSYHQQYGPLELSNTILHEMIHLWLHEQGLPSGHTARFRQKLTEVGLPDRVRALPVPPRPYRYLYRCPTCQREVKTRRKINSSCGHCDGVYNPRHRFRLVQKYEAKQPKSESSKSPALERGKVEN